MRSLTLAASFLVATVTLGAAQTNPPGSAPTSSTNAATRPVLPEAPVGHRQPRASEIPQVANEERDMRDVDPQDAALDRKIRGICRGC